jgi:acyl dehydratase
MNDADYLENVTFDELTIGRKASLTRALMKEDIELFASVSGDVNPEHMDEAYARSDLFHGIVGHGMWSGALISTVLGTLLPGPGTIYLEQDVKFKKPVRIGDKITTTVVVREKKPDKPVVIFDCACVNQGGETVVEGSAVVLAPTEKILRPKPEMPEVEIHTHDRYRKIMEACRGKGAVKTAVAHPVQGNVLEAVADAVKEDLIVPILVGPRAQPGRREGSQHPYCRVAVDRYRAQPCGGGQGRRTCRVRQGRSNHERLAAYGRIAGGHSAFGLRPAHRTSHISCLCHGCFELPQAADRHGRRR